MRHNRTEAHLIGAAAFLDSRAARRWRVMGWSKCCAKLHHNFDPLENYRTNCAKWKPEQLLEKLRELGAPETVCCIDGSVDEAEALMPLEEAVAEVFGQGYGAVISCVPGKLAYYEGEEKGVRMILQR